MGLSGLKGDIFNAIIKMISGDWANKPENGVNSGYRKYGMGDTAVS